jgi:hypothetical protein
MNRKPRRSAVMVDCPGVTNDGRQAHAMRDQCWNCAPFWERIPTCPDDHTKLTTSGYCKTCRKHFETNAE